MRSGLFFAIFGAVSSALWVTFHFEAARKVSPVLGASIVSIVAVVIGLLILAYKGNVDVFGVSRKGIMFLVLVGIAAFASDYFALRTFASDLPLSIGGPIFVGGGVALAALIGLVLGEALTWQVALGIILVASGSALIASIQ
ncbi:hypothetical protein A3A38_00910 [Candidatus Kaiserbacteria bacterium RIFCSPLOWO2_01_FULL_53_17]|uniref:EamA domain-containing protein n=1 Tax=Candidatus Kaiserbacteria bacterium RIFCSPLOWO2_01_FULL_53_17 TaxID=1798511 RepID=A0A1F6EHD5_9BACT|nr:MAG: hypothetical protein A3A38_00910 [Candidatus Kaiserbacteria bacterium RIFCSPLOWO2_01_FULL_53_17]